MSRGLFHFAKMQMFSLSQIVWLQLLCVVLYPMFFHQINSGNDFVNVITFTAGLIILSYLLLRNFAFNDAKCKTRLMFGILPITPEMVIVARGIIVYLFCLIATPIVIAISYITHMIRPGTFAVIEAHILPIALLFLAALMPIEFLIFNLLEAQKADIVGALAVFPYMGFIALVYRHLAGGFMPVILVVIAILTNATCYLLSVKRYRAKE